MNKVIGIITALASLAIVSMVVVCLLPFIDPEEIEAAEKTPWKW